MPEAIAGVTIPGTDPVREATSLARGLEVDPELAYVGGFFHDPGR